MSKHELRQPLRFVATFALCLFATSWLRAETRSSDQIRQAFLKIIDRPKIELSPSEKPMAGPAGFSQLYFTYASDAEQRVPGILLKQTQSAGKLPVVIVAHGTGGKKEGQLPLMTQLAAKGFLAVAIDGRYHGERAGAAEGAKGAYTRAIARAFREGHEHPFFYDTVWDLMRLVDYLKTRSDVDPSRIGIIGFSKGGIETYLAAAVDPRFTVAVPCIGVQSFGWALDNNAWQPRIATIQAAANEAAKDSGVATLDSAFIRRFYDKVVPGIYSDFDGPVMVRLISPRPLLVINGGKDDKTPIPGLMLCADAAKKAYGAVGASDHFVIKIQEGVGHQVTKESQAEAIEWFVRFLKPGAQ